MSEPAPDPVEALLREATEIGIAQEIRELWEERITVYTLYLLSELDQIPGWDQDRRRARTREILAEAIGPPPCDDAPLDE